MTDTILTVNEIHGRNRRGVRGK